MNSIEVRGAVKSYDSKHFILNGLNLTVKTGSIYSLIGASGCGKTTLLSSILGMKRLDKGTIRVFGQEVSYERPSKFSHLIGYMPQETGLVGELTIEETMHFFGNIFQMDGSLMRKRFKMICELLDLRSPNKRVEQLSGGEKRRVSFAAVIIHDPQILILDEPTVGLDSILRERIWNFLIETTQSSNLSVLITTHYIAEAEKSNCCGLMRHGMLMAEDSPQRINNQYSGQNLDETFLNLCLYQTKSEVKNHDHENERSKVSIEMKNIRGSPTLESDSAINRYIKFDKRKKFSKQTLKALFEKEWIRIKRQPAEILFIFIFPLLQIFAFAFGSGKNPIGLKIGIVNYEINDIKFCNKYLESTNYTLMSSSCYFDNLSCYFLNEIQDSVITKVYYNSFDEAFREAKAGITSGILTIAPNISKAISERKMNWEPIGSGNASDSNIIQVYLDQTNLVITSFLQHKIYSAYEKFNKELLRQCELSDILEDLPISYDNRLVYGTFDDDFTKTFVPGVFAQIILLSGILFSISTISQCRVDGVWNRTLLAGVTTTEILLVYIFIFIITDVLQIATLKIAMILLYDLDMHGSEWNIMIFAFTICLVGSSIGLYASIHTNNVLVINSTGILVFGLCGNLCGVFWPLDGQHFLLKYISYCSPITIPSISIKNIITKGFDFTHPTVYGGYSILCTWIIVILAVCFLSLRTKKFTESRH